MISLIPCGVQKEVISIKPAQKDLHQLVYLLRQVSCNAFKEKQKSGQALAITWSPFLEIVFCAILPKGKPCVKCSVDFFGVAEIDGVFYGFIVEVKGRVTGNTAQHARELAWTLGIDEDNPRVQVAYNSPDLKSYFEKVSKSIQILYHAFTFGIKHVLLHVGDQTGIVSGVLARFDNEILADYGKCMKDVEESAIKWAYNESVPFPKNEIIDEVKQHPYTVDVGTVENSFQLWIALTDNKTYHFPFVIESFHCRQDFGTELKEDLMS
jgi:hypothetical protein